MNIPRKQAMFNILDKDGIPVTLTSETWYEKLLDETIGHPEVKNYLEQIKFTIQYPDFIYQSSRDERSKLLYKKGLTTGKYKDCYLLVVVKYVQESSGLHGYVSTVMLTNHIKKRGGLLWKR